jgi:hypothetical protein
VAAACADEGLPQRIVVDDGAEVTQGARQTGGSQTIDLEDVGRRHRGDVMGNDLEATRVDVPARHLHAQLDPVAAETVESVEPRSGSVGDGGHGRGRQCDGEILPPRARMTAQHEHSGCGLVEEPTALRRVDLAGG